MDASHLRERGECGRRAVYDQLVYLADPEQFMELMGLILLAGGPGESGKNGRTARIQLQDLVRQPIKARTVSRDSKFQLGMHALSYFQYRILDLSGCSARTHLQGECVFNLRLEDPIERLLDPIRPGAGSPANTW